MTLPEMMKLPAVVRNAWHLVALSRDIPAGKVAKAIVCGVPLALFRGPGGLAALVDRCPHRNYPLSEGRLRADGLECPYHGWRFGGDGTCLEVPGCRLSGGIKLNAEPVRVIERHGGVFVTLSSEAPAEPPLPPDVGNPALDHFWWRQGRWRGRAYDAVENVMDPFHTGHLHHGLIRRRDRRHPVRLLVRSHGDSIEMEIAQDKPDHGLMSRFLERDRVRSVTRYHPPTIVQARWEGPESLTLCVTAFFTPSTVDSFTPFALFTTPRGLSPSWLKEAAIRLFLHQVIAQDRRALALQFDVMERFGHPKFVAGPGDILGNRLRRLWQGEEIPFGDDPVSEVNL